jgi:hypothetical protein
LPSVHSIRAAGDEQDSAAKAQGSGMAGVVTIEQVEGTDVIVIKGRKKDIESAVKAIVGKEHAGEKAESKAEKSKEKKAEKSGEKNDEAKPWTLPNGMTMWTCESSCGPAIDDEAKRGIAEKKYKLLRTFDDLEHEKINQAIAAGKFRLLNVEVMQTNICRDAESGKKFMVQRMGAGTERDIAVPKTDFGEIPPSVKETSWKEHLQAIRDGKRELLDSHSTNDYKYEMTTDDGSKLMFGYGGDEPLREMPKD